MSNYFLLCYPYGHEPKKSTNDPDLIKSKKKD